MTPLGQSLVFYLKYPTEMRRLYYQSDAAEHAHALDGLEDTQQVLDMVRGVGDAAGKEAAEFLEECARQAQEVIAASARLTTRLSSRRATMEREWFCEIKVYAAGQTTSAFRAGVSMWSSPAITFPWVWVPGRNAGEEALARILGDRAHSRSGKGLVEDAGTIALARIPLLPEGHTGFEADRDPLTAQIRQAFAAITGGEWEAIAAFCQRSQDGNSG